MRPYQIPSVGGEGEGESVIAVDDIITAEDQGDLIEANNEEYHDNERLLLVAKTSSLQRICDKNICTL